MSKIGSQARSKRNGAFRGRLFWTWTRTLIADIFAFLVVLMFLLNRVGHADSTDKLPPAIESDLPALLPSHSAQGVIKFWQIVGSGEAPIVFTGSSQMQAGAVPDQFDREVAALAGVPVTSVNLSVVGAGTVVSGKVIQGLLLPSHVPLILYGIEMRALRPQSLDLQRFDREFAASPLGHALLNSSSIERESLVWLLEHAGVFHHAPVLSDNTPYSLVDPSGHWVLAGVQNRETQNFGEQFVPFEPTTAVIGALQQTLAACQHSATRCVLVNMPLHPGAYQVISAQDEDAYRELLAGLAGSAVITIWDINTPACLAYLGDESFFDLGHLNVLGAERFTMILARLYSRQIARHPAWYLWADSAADCAQSSPASVAR